MAPRIIPDEIEQRLTAWRRYFVRWWNVHYTLGITGAVSSIAVASRPLFLSNRPFVIEGFALIAAVCIVLMTFMMPSRRAKAYVSAWRILSDGCTRYRLDETFSMHDLLDVFTEAEKIIEGSDPS
ncbi:MAG TPA: hypothetical protein VE863_13420 [Pyrinomonadaceae bacterium]|jgi:hypothetical protein|nr:hypothetical protein [Pyrinomonadaceae bacterium]